MIMKRIICLGAILLLAGCASDRQTKPPVTKFTKGAAEVKLVESAASVERSLNQLAQIEKAMHPPTQMPQPINPARYGMANLASVDWIGPIEPLLQKIATATHYNLRVIGRTPPVPIIVSIDSNDKPIADILRNATYQAAKRANVLVYPRTKVIELRYFG